MCKNINNDVIKKQDTKIELETKLLNINEQIDNFIKDIDDITRKIDGLENLKVKVCNITNYNMYNILCQ